MRILLVSTYELGHQPLHVASPAAALRQAGHDVTCVDLSVDAWDEALAVSADAVAFSVPMHTAMRLAVDAATALKARRPEAAICFYGLYAAIGHPIADHVIAGEYEPALARWADGEPAPAPDRIQLGRTAGLLPARDLLPPLHRYARLDVQGEERLAGYVEASRGCSHRCRHCPVPVVYDGRVRLVAEELVLADVTQLVQLGARHITFGDPDFLNAPWHAQRVAEAVHHAFPELTFDCTTKVEHILKYRDLWPALARAGCLFVVSAFESVDDVVLGYLDKGHTTSEASDAVVVLRRHGIEIRPSWLPFTPWTTRQSMADLLDFVAAHDLVGNVDPVQYSVRLLLPAGSLLLDRPEVKPHLHAYDPEALTWTWSALDPAADELQREIARLVEDQPAAGFEEIKALVGASTGAVGRTSTGPPGPRPRLTEPWFCCSEPTLSQSLAVRPA